MPHSEKFFKDFLKNYVKLSPTEFKKILSGFDEIHIKKGAEVITYGESSSILLFITKGILREFTYINEEEHTLWISIAGEPVLDIGSFMTNQVSKISVEALTDSVLLITTKEKFEALLLENQKLVTVTNFLYQNYLQEYREHLMLLREWPAQKREELLYKRKPHLFRKEIKRKHLASLINVHPNSLSRLHNQKS